MGRYDSHSGGGNSGGNYDDDITLKLSKYSTVRLSPTRTGFNSHDQFGDSIIPNFEDVSVLDGVLMQRDDKEGTWKLFGFADLGFNIGEDGGIYESYDADADEFTDELSAQDILDHSRVQGFSEGPFGNTGKLWYTPVGVVIEETGDIAVNDEIVEETPDEPEIPVGEASMLLGNKAWTRTFAKLITEKGDAMVETYEDDDGNEVMVKDDHGWLTSEDPTLREALEERAVELFIIEEEYENDDGETETYTTPILLDVKTGERITIDNSVDELEEQAEEDDEAEAEPAVADGGTKTADAGNQQTTTESPDTPSASEASPDSDDETDIEFDPVIDDLVDYFANSQGGDVTVDEMQEFADGEVDDPDSVDWEAAVAEAEARA